MEDDSLQSFVESLTGEDYLRIQDDLGCGFVRLRAAEAQRRQAKQDIRGVEDVVIELLRNARDAGAHAIFLATWTKGQMRHLVCIDDGCGIPPQMHEQVFEPFVTSKLDTFRSDRWGVHGRGMALYSIRENVDDAHIVASKPGLGSVFSIQIDTSVLPEKRDQSTLPRVIKQDGSRILRGPHNIVRTTIEFAIDERASIAVYLGSPSQIMATLYSFSSAAHNLASIFDGSTESLSYIERPGLAQDAEELSRCAHGLGLPLSSRSCHRILSGNIEPLSPCLALLSAKSAANGSSAAHTVKKEESNGAPRFTNAEVETLKTAVHRAFSPLAQSYYLSSEVPIDLRIEASCLTIRIPLNAQEHTIKSEV